MKDKWADHISAKECECHCGCGLNEMDQGIITAAEWIRLTANVKYNSSALLRMEIVGDIKIYYTSGCRCRTHNDSKAVGGSKTSSHVSEYYCNVCNNHELILDCCTYHGKADIKRRSSKALDGFAYWGDDLEANRVDISDIIRLAWEYHLISGVVLYPYQVCKKCHGMGGSGITLIQCATCGGDGYIKDYRFHIEESDKRFWTDKRGNN